MDLNSLSESDGSSNSSSDVQDGPLCHMNSLMASLPGCKTGLSKFYAGKSQSFSRVADVKCVEELPKREDSYHRKKKKFKGCHNCYEIKISSASMISKRSHKSFFMVSSAKQRRTGQCTTFKYPI